MEKEKRNRSPNYPAMSLGDAIEKLRRLAGEVHHKHAAPRVVVAKGMGYSGLNGASATAISALQKYGLLERSGEDLKITERGMSILHPHTPGERADAIQAAAQEPPLFAELRERFPESVPSEELLRNYLVRNGFVPSAVGSAILAFRETMRLVQEESGAYKGGLVPIQEATNLTPSPPTSLPPSSVSAAQIIAGNQRPERLVSRYDLEGGAYVKVVVGGEIETEEALDWLEIMVQLKRKELSKRKTMGSAGAAMFSVDREEVEGS